MEYRVRWEIDIEADSHTAAAIEALRIQRDRTSSALVFDVSKPEGETVAIDLEKIAVQHLTRRRPGPVWDRSGCRERVCFCHDETGTPYECLPCGCQPCACSLCAEPDPPR